jgi:hypothetical protein
VSASQGAWTCRHGVDGRDWCEQCHAPASLVADLAPGELLAWALEAERALAQIARVAANEDGGRSLTERFQKILALANPWSRSRALAEAVREAVR